MSLTFDEVSPEPFQGGGGGALGADERRPNEAESRFGSGRTVQMDNALRSWAMEKYILHRNERNPIERQWYVNLAFVFGRQNIALARNASHALGFSLHIPKAPPWRVRMVINHCRRIIRTEVSKLASQRPRPFVLPATTEDEDQTAARVGEQILESRFQQPDYGSLHRAWIWWASVCGTSFLKMTWDKHKTTYGGKDGKSETTGDICLERLTPFEILVPDLTQEDLEKQPYLIHGQTMDVEMVKARFNVDVQPDAIGMTDLMEDQFLNLVGSAQIRKNKALVLEVWIKPKMHPQFPDGGMFTVAGGKLVQVHSGWPFKHKEYPFYKIGAMYSGKFYDDSILVDVIPVQRELNRTRSQIVENKNLMSRPKLIAQRGSINPKAITSAPGQIIIYNPGTQPPVPLPPQQLPAYVSQELERLQLDMDDLSGQHEISRGTNPSQVTAATALSYLQEQDDTKLYYQVAAIEDSVSRLGRHYLQLVMQFWDTGRMVRVVGTENIVEADYWQGSDLNGNCDVHVMAGSGLPQSKAAKQAFVMELFKFGILPPDRGLEMLDIAGLERIFEEVLTDKRQIARENLLMVRLTEEEIQLRRQQKAAEAMMKQAQGDPLALGEMALQAGETAAEAVDQAAAMTPEPIIPVNPWDNHQLHVEQHNRFRKTQKFALLPEANKMEFELHVVKHQEMLREELMTQAGQQVPGAIPLGPPADSSGGEQQAVSPVDEEVQAAPPEQGGVLEPFSLNNDAVSGMSSGIRF